MEDRIPAQRTCELQSGAGYGSRIGLGTTDVENLKIARRRSPGTRLEKFCGVGLDMAYEGELLRACPGRMFDFSRSYAVVVSGDDLIPHIFHNKWGHMLLNTGGPGGYYFQTGGPWPYDFPRIMNEAQFRRYLEEHSKFIITVIRIYIPDPDKSRLRLEQLLAAKRWWLGVVHNCESLVEEVVMAGGGPRLHAGFFSLPINSTNQCTAW